MVSRPPRALVTQLLAGLAAVGLVGELLFVVVLVFDNGRDSEALLYLPFFLVAAIVGVVGLLGALRSRYRILPQVAVVLVMLNLIPDAWVYFGLPAALFVCASALGWARRGAGAP